MSNKLLAIGKREGNRGTYRVILRGGEGERVIPMGYVTGTKRPEPKVEFTPTALIVRWENGDEHIIPWASILEVSYAH